jgi:hypothetical protein
MIVGNTNQVPARDSTPWQRSWDKKVTDAAGEIDGVTDPNERAWRMSNALARDPNVLGAEVLSVDVTNKTATVLALASLGSDLWCVTAAVPSDANATAEIDPYPTGIYTVDVRGCEPAKSEQQQATTTSTAGLPGS